MKIINDKVHTLEENLQQLSSKSAHLDDMLSPIVVALKSKYGAIETN